MTNILKYKFLLLSLALLFLVPILSLCWPSLSGKSNLELRKLNDLPKLPDGFESYIEWPADFELFASDRFPFRSELVKITSKLLYPLGISISPRVMVGEDGWLFLSGKNTLEKSRGLAQISDFQLSHWIESYKARKKVLDDLGIPLYTVFVPNKSSVYPQYLSNKNYKVNHTIIDKLVDELLNHQTEGIVDLREYMRSKALSSGKFLYGRYNTHWNDLGAYYAYEKIMSNILLEPISIDRIDFRDVSQPGDLSRLIGNEDLIEQRTVAKVLNSTVVSVNRSESYRKNPIIYKTSQADNPKALIYCDSFTEVYLYKYLKESFSESVFMHHHELVFNKKSIEKINPDIVVYIIVERLVPRKIYNFELF